MRGLVLGAACVLLSFPAISAPALADVAEIVMPVTPLDPPEPVHAVSAVAGFHLAGKEMSIVGAHYRYIVNDRFSFRGGFESGQTTETSPSFIRGGEPSTSTTSISRLTFAALTNGNLYGGLGLTNLTVTVAGPIFPISLSNMIVEPIVGARFNIGQLVVGSEYRYGLNGPGTLTLSGGMRL